MNHLTSPPLIPEASTALIPIQTKNGLSSVDARGLHQFLEVGKDFTTWMQDRIEQFGFSEGSDFSPESGRSPGGRHTKEYVLSLDMAKELSMVERTEKGKQARQYFIACEKALREALPAVRLPSTYAEALRELANTSEQNETLRLENTVLETEKTTLKVENTVLKPKADFYDTVTASDTVCSMAVAAQTAGLPFGQNILYQRLRGEGVLISGGSRHNLPMQRYVEQKLFTVKESTYPKTLGEIGVSFKCLVTQKGIDWLIKKYGDTKAQPELPLG